MMLRIAGALAVLAAPVAAEQYKIQRVIDGDTVEIAVPWIPPPLPPKLSIRVLGIDTPEKAPRAQCEAEAKKAAEASAFTKGKVATAQLVEIEIEKWDKYGGRVLGHVLLDGHSLSDMLIEAGLARPYKGEAKTSWCN